MLQTEPYDTQKQGAPLPAGTYPPPSGNAPPEAPNPPQKMRRVGTFTMGLSLIAVGVLLLLYVIFPEMNILLVLRCLPLVLVLLGVEILVSTIFYHSQKLKYDGLSIFFCLLLILACAVGTTLPIALRVYNGSVEIENRLVAELETESYARLAEEKDIYTLRWVIFIDNINYNSNMQLSDLSTENSPQVQVQMDKQYDSARDFAADCHRILAELREVSPSIRYASFYSYPNDQFSWSKYQGDEVYQLRLDGVFQMNWDVDRMEKNLTRYTWQERYGNYMDEEEYRYWLEQEAIDVDQGYSYIDENLPYSLFCECNGTSATESNSYSFTLDEPYSWNILVLPTNGSVGFDLYNEDTATHYMVQENAYFDEILLQVDLDPGNYSLTAVMNNFIGTWHIETN